MKERLSLKGEWRIRNVRGKVFFLRTRTDSLLLARGKGRTEKNFRNEGN